MNPFGKSTSFHNVKTRKVAVACIATALLLSACSSATDSESPSSSPPTSAGSADSAVLSFDSAAMDSVVSEKAEEFREIAMVVMVTTPTQKYVNTWGSVREGVNEPPTLDTKVRVGSNTKTWTGTAILQLVDEGKVAVTDPVSKFRPDVPNGDNITIGDLLDMRSGLYNYTETLELNRALDEQPELVWTPEELLAMGLSQPPYFAPDTGYHYSNTNTVLLGLIAEQLDGKPIQQIFADRFFGPLALAGTSFPANTDTSIPTPFADGYTYSGNVETLGEGKEALPQSRLDAIAAGTEKPTNTTRHNPSWTWSAGQGISTANDMATWVKALGTGSLLSPATQELRLNSVQPTDGEGSAGYGYGIAQMGPMYGHIGELPGYNSFMGYDPVNDVTLVVWGNLAPTANGFAPASAVAAALVPFIYGKPAQDTSDDIADTEDANGEGK
ncbi:beta-lactamase family protein [Rhodococcus erythropolis]|uniref:serine hydrolase domain-containing protein n=1 Tax=Rhodococcus erythropolis TaxID=1833 RepID=UPI001BAD0C09|nr:serine hydrolase domain-containing protein [Rhodococcus erythropolis]MBS2988190.1 beta-lactamase family protein [Rhodococcus erythropolis]